MDVWAFGAVLYEMITGQRAFQGGSYASLVAAILAGDPPRMAVKAFGPSRTERLVRRCLEKDPERRYQSMRDIVLDLEAPVVESAEPPKPDHWPWVVAAACAVAFLALAAIAFRQPPPDLPAMALSILPPEKAVFNETAISPDGKLLAFTVTLEGKQQLWIRPLNALTARPLAGTEGATDPFWSPDSRWIGFFARGKLRKIQAAGGPARTLCEAGVSRGGTWNAEGVILFSDVESGLFRVPEEGGARTPVTIQPALGSAHRWPKFLPRGRRFVYEVLDKDDNTSGIYAGSLDTKERVRLVGETSSPGYAEGPGGEGYLLCAREGKLVAQRLEGGRGAVTGEAFTVAENVGVDWATGRTRFSVSGQGLLVYEPRGSDQPRLTWVDRAGKRLDAIGEPGDNFMLAHLSPDGKQVAFVHDHDIKVWDLTRGISTRVTFDRALDNYPVWSPDGRSIAFRSNREGTFQLYVKSVGGTGPEELLLKTGSSKTPSSWAAGGRLLLYSETDPKTKEDLWVLPIDGERKPTVLLRTEFNEGDGSFSPDGKWIAYTSDESGKDEVYVQPYPATGVKSRVSKDGGRWPMWRRDGREMYWVDERGTIMSADLGAAPALQPGIPRAVFERRLQNPSDRYAVSGDGQRFLIPLPPVEVDAVRPVTVVQNFLAGAKR